MSRGLGARERHILAACRHAATGATPDSWWVTARELADTRGHSEFVVVNRAMGSLVQKGMVEQGQVWRTIPVGSEGITRERKLIAVRLPLTPEQLEIEADYLASIQERRAQVIHELVTLAEDERRLREGIPAAPGVGSRGRGGDAS